MKSHHYCWIGIGLVGLLASFNFAAWIVGHANSADVNADLTNYVPTQNNWFPNGSLSSVGTRATTYEYPAEPKPDKTWIQGGRSMVTNSTGRWAE